MVEEKKEAIGVEFPDDLEHFVTNAGEAGGFIGREMSKDVIKFRISKRGVKNGVVWFVPS